MNVNYIYFENIQNRQRETDKSSRPTARLPDMKLVPILTTYCFALFDFAHHSAKDNLSFSSFEKEG